jgi:hypothetical protein
MHLAAVFRVEVASQVPQKAFALTTHCSVQFQGIIYDGVV